MHHQRPNRIFCKPKATSLNLPLGPGGFGVGDQTRLQEVGLEVPGNPRVRVGDFWEKSQAFRKGSRSVGSRWAGENMVKEALKVLIHDITLVIFTIVVDKLYKWFSMGHGMADL